MIIPPDPTHSCILLISTHFISILENPPFGPAQVTSESCLPFFKELTSKEAAGRDLRFQREALSLPVELLAEVVIMIMKRLLLTLWHEK